ncbi:LysR substrate-binding domain-containing protein [Vibrio ishigakensis]|uniref:LysR substrate-binding domain-containing protein n=1 Tax=Vibrio ishigakensis TaxID=1481914 RepID=UPI0021C301D6|nr:LysR substrate-binding domain-containing protein [Vibrio ishigakensis]
MIPYTLRQLEVFTSIAKASSLSEAANTLFLSKAATSLALNELEKQLGHTLFDRINNRLVLNQEGSKLLPVADEVLNRARDISSLLSNEKILSGELKLGASNTIGNQLLPILIRDFNQSHQANIEFTIELSNSLELANKVIDYQLDMAFIESGEDSDKLSRSPFGHDKMCVICSIDSPLLSLQTPTLTDLEDHHWIMRESGSGSRDYFTQHIANNLQTWHKRFELNSSEAIITSVSAGLGLACLSELSVETAIKAGKVSKLELSLPQDRGMQLVLHRDKYLNPLLSAFKTFALAWRLDDQLANPASRLDCNE